MEKSKSFPDYSGSYVDARFEFDDRCKSFSFNGHGPGENPEMKRRKRVANYNMYTTEGKLKSSFRNSFRWIKNKFCPDGYYD